MEAPPRREDVGELKLGEVREKKFTEAAGVGQWGGLRGHPP